MFSQYGFKKKNKAFVRVINDVMQNFAIEKLGSGRIRLEFAIIPLSLRIEKNYILGGVYSYNLRRFEPARWTHWDEWVYNSKSDESMEACINEILRYLTSYLIPLFENACSCKTALPKLIKLEKHFNQNRIAGLKADGIEDGALEGAGLNLLDSSKYFMALKSGDYEYALKSRKALLEQNIESYKSMKDNSNMTKEILHERYEAIQELQEEIRHLEEDDRDYFNAMIVENETYSREVLKGL